jgi:hypothetical protein
MRASGQKTKGVIAERGSMAWFSCENATDLDKSFRRTKNVKFFHRDGKNKNA